MFIVTHTSWSDEENDTTTKVELFYKVEDAMAYYDLIKFTIIDEYECYTGRTIEQLIESNEDIDYEYFYCSETEIEPYLDLGLKQIYYIRYDDYGSDTLTVEKKEVLSFN